MEAQCPCCDTLLAPDSAAGVQVDACPKCAGIWFDGGELARLAQARPGCLAGLEHRHDSGLAGGQIAPRLGGRLCPVCRVFMREFEFPWAPGIRLDGCTGCHGIWADDGELTRIEALAAQHRRQAAAPSQYREAAAAELGIPNPPPAPVPDRTRQARPEDWQKQLLRRIRAAEDLFSRFQRE